MSLMIKGINLPDKGDVIHLEIYSDGSVWDKSNWEPHPPKASAIQIPKGHGRLIDEGQVVFDIVGLDAYKMEIDDATFTMRKDVDILPTIRHAPTILDKERE